MCVSLLASVKIINTIKTPYDLYKSNHGIDLYNKFNLGFIWNKLSISLMYMMELIYCAHSSFFIQNILILK